MRVLYMSQPIHFVRVFHRLTNTLYENITLLLAVKFSHPFIVEQNNRILELTGLCIN